MIIFLVIALSCVAIEAFFSMFEMAAVSLNKARLTYYASLKNKKAVWLDYLLKKPSRLFGTTIIAVNTVLQIGSEAARRFYESINLSPDLAPITQVLLVIIFAELSPLFAARRYPERIALFNVSIVYFLSKIFLPLTWIIDGISAAINFIFGKKGSYQFYLTKEEIQKAFEEKEKSKIDINTTISNIFSLKQINAKQIMIPLSTIKMMPSNSNIKQLKNFITKDFSSYILVYHDNMQNIVSVVTFKDLLKPDFYESIKNYGQSPWFISEKLSIFDILNQFKRNNQDVGIILNKSGKATGIITLDVILNKIFGSYQEEEQDINVSSRKLKRKQIFIEKTLLGEMLVSDFNNKFKANLPDEGTLSDLINKLLDHHPSAGEMIHIENFEFTVTEPTLLGTKTVKVRNIRYKY